MSKHSRDVRRVTRDARETKSASVQVFARATLFFNLTMLSATWAHAEGFSDPMRPLAAHNAASPAHEVAAAVHVTAIFSSDDRRVAVLDGRVVKVGDRIGDLLVQEITADGVRYTRAGRVEFARLPTQAAQVRREAAEAEEGQ